MERLVEVVIVDDLLTNQQRVGGPDNGPVQGIDIGQQGVGQVLDVVEELDPGGCRQVSADAWMLVIHAWVEQLRHRRTGRNPRMAYLSFGHRLYELSGEHGIALDAVVNHKLR
ncbi:hypothetical protein D3C72_1759540 [compost metagenome]